MQPDAGTLRQRKWHMRGKMIRQHWPLYLFLLPTIVYFLLFRFYPLYGLQLAFKNYRVVDGIAGSPWAGADHFRRFSQRRTSES